MKILAIGDMHVKASNLHITDRVMSEIANIIAQNNIDIAVVLGDMSDTFETVHLSALTAIESYLIKLSSMVPTYYVVGNHDAINNRIYQTDEHFFRFFKHIPNLFIIDKAITETIEGRSITFCPYVEPGRFLEAIKPVGGLSSHLIFAHQEFGGVQMGPITSKSPDLWRPDWPQVVSGHIHEAGEYFGGKVRYVGAPFQTNFGENNNKCVEIIDLNDLSFTKIKLKVPQKIKINTSATSAALLDLDPLHEYKINITDTAANIELFKRGPFYLKSGHKFGFIVADKTVVKRVKRGLSYIDILRAAAKINDLAEVLEGVLNDG